MSYPFYWKKKVVIGWGEWSVDKFFPYKHEDTISIPGTYIKKKKKTVENGVACL